MTGYALGEIPFHTVYLLGTFDYGKVSTTTIVNNSLFSWTIATSTTAKPLFKIDTTTGTEQVSIGAFGSDLTVGDVGSASNLVFEENSTIKGQGAGRTITLGANSDVINFGVKTGIGSTTPWANLSILTNSAANESAPAFVIATTSTITPGVSHPLFYVGATTTGALNYARVAVGTTTVWGTAGLRDQFTVDGRMYSTWTYLSCDVPSSFLAAGLTTTDTANACGDFMYDAATAGTYNATGSQYPGFTTLTHGASAAADVAIRAATNFVFATTSPVMEARVRISTTGGTTQSFIVGFADDAIGASGATAASGIYFSATSTQNWFAIVRKAGTEVGRVDTGVSTSTSAGTS
jgi:hypothetical protein